MNLNEMAFNINKANKEIAINNDKWLIGKFNENEMLKPSEIEYIQIQFDIIKLADIIGDLSKAIDAERIGKNANEIMYADEYLDNFDIFHFNKYIADTSEFYLARALNKLLDYCSYQQIDIELIHNELLKYNATREYMHGKEF